jgi:glycyl-tRNA synthetase
MFIVKKKVNDNEYYYARESQRVGDKVKAKTIAYLGKNRKEAQEKFKNLKPRDKIMETKAGSSRLENSKAGSSRLENSKAGSSRLENNLKPIEALEVKKGSIEAIEEKANSIKTIDEIASFCKRKGFIFKSSEIYGGLSGFWDFGPLGIELFNNIKKDFWKFFVQEREDMVGIEASVISHPKTWLASGHVSSFQDVAVVCKKCKKATKLDKSEVGKVKCDCGGEYEVQGTFSLLFKTSIGALNPMEAYLRGETAQGMFLDFKQVQETSRKQLPFGILQIGRCFRNEIAPRDFLFRSREFNIGEFEFFIHPEEKRCELLDDVHRNVKIRLLSAENQEKASSADAEVKGKEELVETTIGHMIKEGKMDEWHGYWLAEQVLWFKKLGLSEKIKIREHMKQELSHYSSATFDLDYEYPFGSKEIGGNANRGQYDLKQHEKESKQDMSIFDEKTKARIIPRVIEPTFGIERVLLALLCQAYHYDIRRNNVVLKLPNYLAPIKAAVFPLVNDEKMQEMARFVYLGLRKEFNVSYDKSGSVGRRYSRNDEIGTPYCITIDGQSLEDGTVTVRDRDTTQQIRVSVTELVKVIKKLLEDNIEFEEAGKLVETRVKD